MVSSPTPKSLVYDVKLSSVGPGSITNPPGMVFEPTGMDLAMKLHYLRGIYYFESYAFEGVNTLKVKEPWFDQFPTLAIKQPMFGWFNQFPLTCGRFRRDEESGRPYIKCNDSGVRFTEAKCDKTIEEWLEIKDANLEKLLTPNQCLGPDLQLSPLVLLQFTKFKCGGMAVGLSWAHVLGDAFSVAEFMNSLGPFTSPDYKPERPYIMTQDEKDFRNLPENVEDPLSIKRVDPVGDTWTHIADCEMELFSFDVTPAKLADLQSKLRKSGVLFTPFEVLSAVTWRCIAKVRGAKLVPNVITIFKKGQVDNDYGVLSNSQVASVVKAEFNVSGANLGDIASLVKKGASDERIKVDEAMERDNGLPDVILYGANLTFVDFNEAKFYDFKWKGYRPVNVSYRIDGVGEQGAVFVHPARKDGSKNGGGRSVMTILPKDEVIALKSELEIEGLIVA